MKKVLLGLALAGAILTSFSNDVYAKEVNINLQNQNEIAVAASGSTYYCSIYFDSVIYHSAPETFTVHAGQSVEVSWGSGRKFNMYLRNNTTGNITSIKSGRTSVTYTGMREGNYSLVASDSPNDLPIDENKMYTQTFTVKTY